jgi:LCP family protein required for cell wall assembly
MSYSRYDDEFYDEVEQALRRKYGDDPIEEEPPLRRSDRSLSRTQRKRLEQARIKLEKKKKRKKRLKVFGIVLLLLCAFGIFLVFTKPGQNILLRIASTYAGLKMNNDDSVVFTAPENVPEGWIYDENVVNVLLVGIEQNGGANNTDSMMLVSENRETGQLTLVSFLRDTYVEIDGLGVWRKLNYAYSHGDGMSTTINTIQNTYHIFIDGYASVDYASFEDVIDKLGGVDIEITQKEADYLNSTNYISDPSNRNLTSGVNHFNGNQALGYCRVRKVATLEGVNNDYGRTLRQRKVVSAIFDEYKDQNILQIKSTTDSILGSLTSSLTSKQIYTLLSAYNNHRTDSMNSIMIPAEGYFTPKTVDGVGSVLSIAGYEQDNIDILQATLYGKAADGYVLSDN